MDTDSFRRDVVAWLDANADELAPPFEGFGSLDAQIEQYRRVKRLLFDADLGRYGWPESVGGLGGPPILRAVVGEEVAIRDLTDPGAWSMIEVLAPTVMSYGSDELVAEMLPPLLRGDEMWSQGFSEPGTGSDLSSLSCKATRVDGGWVVNGQKVWTSFVQYTERCVLLTRTGAPDSAHRGITAFFVDVDSPGISYSPIEIQNGRLEFAEVFYDDVFVPESRLLGEVNGGWSIAMDILPYERSTTFWHRGAYLHHLCSDLIGRVAGNDPDAAELATLGSAFADVMAFRVRSRNTQHRLAAGEPLGAETSIDKILIATAEQELLNATHDLLPGVIEFGTDAEAETLRMDYLYSKAATIYGGTGEIQRNIVARRLLDLGAES